MKVTALIDDELIDEVKKLSAGKNITDSITIALREWVAQKKIGEVTNMVLAEPIVFDSSYSAKKVREMNRDDEKDS